MTSITKEPFSMADFDASIAAALENDETFQGLIKELTAAASAEVTVRDPNPCTKCSCKHIRMVKVPDYKLKLQIMEFLANRGVGRPKQTEETSDERIVFERTMWMYDAQADETQLEVA